MTSISLKSPTVLFVVGALAVGAVGSKMLWTDAPAIKVPVATPKPSAPSATHAVAAGQPHQTPRAIALAKQAAAAAAAEPANIETAAAPLEPVRRQPVPQVQPQSQATLVPVTAREALPSQPAAVEQDEAPSFAKPARVNIAAAKRAQPSEIDSSSDTEGLFLISSLKDGQNGDAGKSVESKQAAPAVNTAAAQTTLSEPANNALGEQVVTTSTGPAAAPGPVTDGLGPVFVDDANGYYLRFPAAWSIRKFDGEPWVIECGDGKSALMSVGFSPFPAEYTADNIPLDWVARRVKKRPDTVLNAQGYATIMGRKAIWSKSTGPMQMGGNQVKVIRTTYIIPIGDGRIAEIRIAAAPDQYEKIANLMKNAVSTFRLVPKRAPETMVAKTDLNQ